jgi:hypothetical protein
MQIFDFIFCGFSSACFASVIVPFSSFPQPLSSSHSIRVQTVFYSMSYCAAGQRAGGAQTRPTRHQHHRRHIPRKHKKMQRIKRFYLF